MATISPDIPFVLISGVNGNNAIQAQQGGGSGLTLQPFDSTYGTLTQQFVLRMQNNSDNNGNVVTTGIAFVNLGSFDGGLNNSVTAQGLSKPLLMESYSPASIDEDAWTLVEATANGRTGIRITSPANAAWSWNDWGGTGDVGDPIYLYDDKNNNSVWIVTLVPQFHPVDAKKQASQKAPELLNVR